MTVMPNGSPVKVSSDAFRETADADQPLRLQDAHDRADVVASLLQFIAFGARQLSGVRLRPPSP